MRAAGGAGHHQVDGEVGIRRGEDDIVIQSEDDHVEPVVSDQGIVQLLRNQFEIALRVQFLKGMTGQFHLALQNLHVLLLEVFFHRRGDHEAERQQHGRRGEDEQQRQTPGN